MRIAILGTRGIPARYGGFETFAEELSTRLAANGFEVTVFCQRSNSNHAPEYKGVKLRYVRDYRVGSLSTVIFDFKCFVNSIRGYDLIYMLGYGAGIFMWLPRLFKKHVWVNMDGIEWKRSKWPWHGRLYLRINEWFAVKSASLIIADAEAIADYLRTKYGKHINCHTIPYGAEVVDTPPDINLIKAYGLKPFEYYLVVCRLEPENHVKEILEGFGLSGSQRSLVVIGDHEKGTPYVRELLKMDDKGIRFVGTVYDRELLKAIRYYSFAYFHGHSAGGTNPSLLEALGCGNMVIAHDNPFNREVAGEKSIYFSDSKGVARAVDELEQGDFDIESARMFAQSIIRERYTWEKITDEYNKLIVAL